MPSPFDEIDASAQEAIDETFGEGVTVRPQAGDVNYGGAADPARPVRTDVRASVLRAPATANIDIMNTDRPGRSITAGPSEVWFDRVAYAGLGYEIKRGDVLELEDGSRHVTAAVLPGENGDATVTIAAAGEAEE